MKKVGFYRKDGKWYADVAGHTEAQNMMIAGADKFCEMLDNYFGKPDGQLTLTVGEEDMNGDYIFKLRRLIHDTFGATYSAKYNGYDSKKNRLFWLCNVVHSVFGDHPKYIYIYRIE